jgi:NADH dehydrogenase/NADH:ubiquinone oxidoreductase subunit G
VELRVDGLPVIAPSGATVLEACDLAGRYVPRLCSYPELGCSGELGVSCGLCAVQIDGNGRDGDQAFVLACSTSARPGMSVSTSGPALYAKRLRRLTAILNHHPHICLSCPDRDGCNREECTFGNPVEARCCAEFGRCEFGKLVAHVDAGLELKRWAAVALRDAHEEGRIRREPGLCIGCGRCVLVCTTSEVAGNALQLEDIVGPAMGGPAGLATIQSSALAHAGARCRAVPVKATLRASGCTFCGQCVMVCPTGAVTAPGEAGARWLEGWRKRIHLAMPVLPPDSWRLLTEDELAAIPSVAGVFQLADDAGQVLRIGGVPDLSRGVALGLTERSCRSASRFWFEPAELFTQRESELLARFAQEEGHLPPGNDLGDDLFSDDLLDENLE